MAVLNIKNNEMHIALRDWNISKIYDLLRMDNSVAFVAFGRVESSLLLLLKWLGQHLDSVRQLLSIKADVLADFVQQHV